MNLLSRSLSLAPLPYWRVVFFFSEADTAASSTEPEVEKKKKWI